MVRPVAAAVGVSDGAVLPRPNCPLALRPQQSNERREITMTLSSAVTAPNVTAQVNAAPPVMRLKRALAFTAVGDACGVVVASPS